MHNISVLLCLFMAAGICCGASVKQVAPEDAPTGKICEWKSKDGLAYQFVIPKSYDKTKGANLTFILHGSNLTRTWGFANHKVGNFRIDDILVSPDGTTSNGNGGFNFLGKDTDLTRFEALHKELVETFKVNATFLYGHSQGSFFALHYAGAKPESVQGVLAHASGVWTWTKLSPKAHHQAIVFMHGTQDPVVPYGQSVGGYEVFQQRNYPTVRLRSLEGWNHWPAEHNGPIPHVSQQLAWIEGMTSEDPKRLAEVFKTLGRAKDKSQHDFAALYRVAMRVKKMNQLPAGARKAADKAIKNIDALTKKHVAILTKAMPNASLETESAAWMGHLPMFLRNFDGVPAADALQKKWTATFKQHNDASSKHLGNYYKLLRSGQKKDAFSAGLEGISSAFLTTHAGDNVFLKGMENLSDSAKSIGIEKDEIKRFKILLRNYRKALTEGRKTFERLNKRASL